jgi:hypothetical protein
MYQPPSKSKRYNIELRTTMEHKSSSVKKNLLSLNDDCLSEIFRHISVEDLLSIADTCERFRGIVRTIYRVKLQQKYLMTVFGPRSIADAVFYRKFLRIFGVQFN